MPNWCHNSLFVDGDINELEDFKSKVLVKTDSESSLDFTMEILWPTPPELLETVSPPIWNGDENDVEGKVAYEKHNEELIQKYGYNNWYDWRVSNWKTKWDVCESWVDEHDGDTLSVEYDTAWGPNDGFIVYASEKYPKLKFRLLYEEPGCNFCGELVCEDGEVRYMNEGELEYEDDNGNLVEWNSEKERYVYCETGEVIEDEDFYPNSVNPFF